MHRALQVMLLVTPGWVQNTTTGAGLVCLRMNRLGKKNRIRKLLLYPSELQPHETILPQVVAASRSPLTPGDALRLHAAPATLETGLFYFAQTARSHFAAKCTSRFIDIG